MDSRVSARVPIEKRKRGDGKLAQLGATTTQLINAAYDYLNATGELPHVPRAAGTNSGKLSEAQKAQLKARLKNTTHHVPAQYFSTCSDAEILERELKRAYESLA